MDTEVWIKMFYEDKSLPSALWHIEKFWNRVYLMRETYQVGLPHSVIIPPLSCGAGH